MERGAASGHGGSFTREGSVGTGVRRAQRDPLPPVLTLAGAEDEGGEAPNFAVLFLPGIVLMALFVLAGGISEDMWRERLQGTHDGAPVGLLTIDSGQGLLTVRTQLPAESLLDAEVGVRVQRYVAFDNQQQVAAGEFV